MTDRLKRDGWVPYAKSIGTAAVAAVVLTVSAVRLVALAELCHIDSTLSWTLPVALDVGGGVATIIWTKNGGNAAKWGMYIALLSLAESLAGNVLSDLIQANLLAVTPQLIIGVGAVYPITLFLMIHLLVQSGGKRVARPVTRPEPKRAEAVRQEPAAQQAAVVAANTRKPIEAAPPKVVPIGELTSKRELGRAWFHEQVLAHDRDPNTVTASEVDAAIGANGYAKKHIAGWRTEVLAATQSGTAAAGN